MTTDLNEIEPQSVHVVSPGDSIFIGGWLVVTDWDQIKNPDTRPGQSRTVVQLTVRQPDGTARPVMFGPDAMVLRRDPVKLEECILKAAMLIDRYGGYDGALHKRWVLDQVQRALLGADGYAEWLADWESKHGYQWDTGIAP